MKKKSTGLLFITPFILFFMLFWLIPFIYGIVMSLSKYSLIMGNQGFVGFSNYIKILGNCKGKCEIFYKTCGKKIFCKFFLTFTR